MWRYQACLNSGAEHVVPVLAFVLKLLFWFWRASPSSCRPCLNLTWDQPSGKTAQQAARQLYGNTCISLSRLWSGHLSDITHSGTVHRCTARGHSRSPATKLLPVDDFILEINVNMSPGIVRPGGNRIPIWSADISQSQLSGATLCLHNVWQAVDQPLPRTVSPSVEQPFGRRPLWIGGEGGVWYSQWELDTELHLCAGQEEHTSAFFVFCIS